MGIFNKTEKEKMYDALQSEVRNNIYIDNQFRSKMLNYISDVEFGYKNNIFFNDKYFIQAMIMILPSNSMEYDKEYLDFDDIITKIKNVIDIILPNGSKTPDYDYYMESIVSNFVGYNKIIDLDIFTPEFYTLFSNYNDFMDIMNLIRKNDLYLSNYNTIIKYALNVKRFCKNGEVFKAEILSFMYGLENNIGNNYYEDHLNIAKQKAGVYSLDEERLALIYDEAQKAKKLISRLEELQKKVEVSESRIASSSRKALMTINDESKKSKELFSKEMKDYSEAIIEHLDEYLIQLKNNLKDSSDEIFRQILIDAQKKIDEIKIAAKGIYNHTNTELLRIQTAASDSIGEIRSYLEDEPKLQELLKSAKDSSEIRQTLIEISNKQVKEDDDLSSGILIAGNARRVIPAGPNVIIPKEGTTSNIIPAFDESIPFDIRMEKILNAKKIRESQGEIFHEKTDDVIRCILENDWPYLWGPSGCGKSHTISQIASLIGIDMVDNGKITDKYSVMAYNDPQGRFRATQAFVAFVYGKLLRIDEFDNGNTDTQVVLNELYSASLDILEHPDRPRYVTFAEDMTVPVNPNFRMISAGNTSGEGENIMFSSRGKIDESVQQRMTPIKFWYDNRVEEIIFGTYKDWYGLFVSFRKACDEYATSEGLDTPAGVVTTRDAAAIKRYIMHNSKSLEQVLYDRFVQTKNPEYLKYIAKKLRTYYDIDRCTLSELPSNLHELKEHDIAKKLIKMCEAK